MARELESYWFNGTRSGCGTGRTIAWQGWALSGAYGAAVMLSAPLAERSWIAFVALLVAATSVFLVVCNAKTRGGIRLCWSRGGSRDRDRKRS